MNSPHKPAHLLSWVILVAAAALQFIKLCYPRNCFRFLIGSLRLIRRIRRLTECEIHWRNRRVMRFVGKCTINDAKRQKHDFQGNDLSKRDGWVDKKHRSRCAAKLIWLWNRTKLLDHIHMSKFHLMEFHHFQFTFWTVGFEYPLQEVYRTFLCPQNSCVRP